MESDRRELLFTIYSVCTALGGLIGTLVYYLVLEFDLRAFLLFLLFFHVFVGFVVLVVVIFLNKRLSVLRQVGEVSPLLSRHFVLKKESMSVNMDLHTELPVSQVMSLLLKSISFWLILAISLIAIGLISTFTTTLGNVAAAIDSSDRELIAVSVLVFGVFQATGRLCTAILIQFTPLKNRKIVLLFFIATVLFASYLILFFSFSKVLLNCSVGAIAFVYGSIWTIAP